MDIGYPAENWIRPVASPGYMRPKKSYWVDTTKNII